MPDSRFIPAVGEAELRREKARARELRGSGWWKRRIAAGICVYTNDHVSVEVLS